MISASSRRGPSDFASLEHLDALLDAAEIHGVSVSLAGGARRSGDSGTTDVGPDRDDVGTAPPSS